MPFSAVKGMNDILPPETRLWRKVEERGKQLFDSFGYEEIRTPIVERTELFARSVGDTTDIVEKQMYSFEDKNGESLALRPEGTASVVRAFIESGRYAQDPVARFHYWGPMFRYERMQKGRYRQFHQYGLEVFGIADPKIDAEMMAMCHLFYQEIGIDNARLELNSLGCQECRPQFRKILTEYLDEKVAQLCPDCNRRVRKNPLRILDCKVESCQQALVDAPSSLDTLCVACHHHHDGVKKGLNELSVPWVEKPRLVRGLDYYVRTAFEFVAEGLGAQNALGGGGRYDGLVGQLGGPQIPAIGFAGGMERLILVLADKNKMETASLDLFIAALGEKAQDAAFTLAYQLRRMGMAVAMDYENRSLKSQLKRADKWKAKLALIVGEDELAERQGVLRDMKTGVQNKVDLDGIEETLMRLIKGAAKK